MSTGNPMEPAMLLPHGEHVELGALAALFRDTTNSYKYLFFLSLIDEIWDHGSSVPSQLHTRDVIVGSLALAWYPAKYFRLSFGTQDQLVPVLDAICERGGDELDPRRGDGRDAIRAFVDHHIESNEVDQLSRYVPCRLLSPWFQAELRGHRDARKNGMIRVLATQEFESRRPLYRPIAKDQVLEVHPDWWEYVVRNYRALREWVLWHWLLYLQPRNATVPNLAAKLVPVAERSSLTWQREYWQKFLSENPLRCIYTEIPLVKVEALDHVLPWSFVAHDQLWNLVPVHSNTNSSKGDRLPPLEEVGPRLADAHGRALVAARSYVGRRQLPKVIAEYAEGLKADANALEGSPDQVVGELRRVYSTWLPHYASLARLQGFQLWTMASEH